MSFITQDSAANVRIFFAMIAFRDGWKLKIAARAVEFILDTKD